MGHSTSSGRNTAATTETGAAQETTRSPQRSTQEQRRTPRRPRDVAANSRLGRAWKEAQNGEADQVVREYAEKIQQETYRMRRLKNSFMKQASQQEIDRLTAERRRIERAFLD